MRMANLLKDYFASVFTDKELDQYRMRKRWSMVRGKWTFK
jgi:hypothetical protein